MFRILLLHIILLFVLSSYAQQPSFKNFKSNTSPYLQFNDVVIFQNNVLFITNEGLFKFEKEAIIQVLQKENLSKFIVVNKQLFIWSIFGEIYEFKNKKLHTFPFNTLLSKRLENSIINTMIYSDSSFYISTIVGSQVIQVDLRTETIKTLTQFRQNPYFITQFGKKLITGTNQNTTKNELAIYLTETPFFIPLADENSNSKSNIIQLKDNTYLFTKQHEVIRFNSSSLINRIFSEKNIEAIHQDRENKIWCALNNGGIIVYADGNLKESNSTRYLGNQTVISIAEDTLGNLWFGTSGNGVYLLEKNEIESVNSNTINYKTPHIFSNTNTENEKIQSKFIIKNLPLIKEDASFAAVSSPSRIISIKESFPDSISPIVFVNSIKINGIDTTTLSHYELSYQFNSIELTISGVNSNKSDLQYKYILEGKDVNWTYSVSTSVYYASLQPGYYTFKVFAMNDSGIWSRTPAIVTFNISQPFYASIWFILSGILLLIVLLFIVLFFINKQNQQKNKLLEEQKQKILFSELQVLRNQMNPHFIFNTLNSIQSFITNNESKDAVIYLSKFAKLMRATLANTKRQKISLKDEIDTLRLYLELEQLRLNNKFSYEIIVDDKIDIHYEQVPSMLIQPYVENAIWHGISTLEGKGIIRVQFLLEKENLLKCIIEDNGIGREQAMKTKKSTSTSFGMSITKERIEILNSLEGSNLTIKVHDLTKNNKPAGTRIELFLPI